MEPGIWNSKIKENDKEDGKGKLMRQTLIKFFYVFSSSFVGESSSEPYYITLIKSTKKKHKQNSIIFVVRWQK